MKPKLVRSIKLSLWSLIAGSLILILLPAIWLTPERYSAYAGAVQAFGVLVALIIAVGTLRTDTKDRRVDRTLQLHQELTSGEIGEARRRLGIHFREKGSGTIVGRAHIADLRDDPGMSKYTLFPEESPYQDVNLLMRFFERARLVQVRESIDEPLFVELIGRHAAWWESALLPDQTNARLALKELASWVNQYARDHRSDYQFLKNWGLTRARDFRDPSGTEESDLAPGF
jgi:hypothetical protein